MRNKIGEGAAVLAIVGLGALMGFVLAAWIF